MKRLHGYAYILGASLLGIGVATIVTNPDQDSYEAYASQRLSIYLQDNVCNRASILESTCESALRDNQPQIQQFITQGTERQNYLFWSVYRTNLSVDELLPSVVQGLVPSYHFETVGIFSSFYTYRAEQIR
ncbi:MAG: hypothetical protein Kow00121_56240 [Elainellaceae cyanobacterium]